MILKKICVYNISLAFLAALLLASPAQAQTGFKIRLYGGYGYLSGGDLNTGTEGLANIYLGYYRYVGATVNGSFQPVHFGLNLGGDFIFMFTPIIGMGIGADYVKASTETKIISTQASSILETTIKPSASAIPLKLSLYLCLPAGSGFRMNFNAGIAYYLATMSNSVRQDTGSHFFEEDNQAKAKGFGFQGGLGFEFDLSSQVGLFIGAQGRYADIGGFKGDYYYKFDGGTLHHYSGTLYYFEELGLLPLFYPVILVKTAPPTASPSIKHIREAKIDYSGGALLGGIVVRF